MIRTTITLDDALAARIGSRASRGMRPDSVAAAAGNELGVLDTLLGLELRHIRLTVAEAQALAAVTTGSMFEPYTLGMLLYAEASDAFRLASADDPTGGKVSSYAAQYGIDEQVLLNKLLARGCASRCETVRESLRPGAPNWASTAERVLRSLAMQPPDRGTRNVRVSPAAQSSAGRNFQSRSPQSRALMRQYVAP